MATLVIPKSVQSFFPKTGESFQLWMNYNPQADSLTICFTGQPVSSIWQDVDDYAYIGFDLDDAMVVTGLKIEHLAWFIFNKNNVTKLSLVAAISNRVLDGAIRNRGYQIVKDILVVLNHAEHFKKWQRVSGTAD